MALFDLSKLLGIVPVDPKSLMEQASGNVQDATNAANAAAANLEGTRKSLEAAQKAASQATAKAYATTVENRKSDLTITAETAASLKEVTPSGVTSLSEFNNPSANLTNFEENLHPLTDKALDKGTDTATKLGEAYLTAQLGPAAVLVTKTNVVSDMAKQANSLAKLETKNPSEMITSKVSAAVGGGKVGIDSVPQFGQSVVGDPKTLVNDPSGAISKVASGSVGYAQSALPGNPLSSSITSKSAATSAALKAMDNKTAIKADPSIFDTCLQTVQKSTGSYTDIYQGKIERVLKNAVNDPASFDVKSKFSSAMNTATTECVEKAMSGTGSKSVSLMESSGKSLLDKVSSGIVSTETATKAKSMMSKSLDLPGMDRVGTVGQKIYKSATSNYQSKLSSVVNQYARKTQSVSTSKLTASVGKMF